MNRRTNWLREALTFTVLCELAVLVSLAGCIGIVMLAHWIFGGIE